jgi:hypothetical protein
MKTNLLAREVFISKNSEYSVNKVVELALRQDIGADPAYPKESIKR